LNWKDREATFFIRKVSDRDRVVVKRRRDTNSVTIWNWASSETPSYREDEAVIAFVPSELTGYEKS
jgi:hypothetical protein